MGNRFLTCMLFMLFAAASLAQPFTADFNRDGAVNQQDVVDFETVLAGGSCSTGNCGSIDINRDETFPSDEDYAAFYTLYAGGTLTDDKGFPLLFDWPGSRDVYVSSIIGDDANPGTRERPFKTIEKGVAAVCYPGGWPSSEGGWVHIDAGGEYRDQSLQVDNPLLVPDDRNRRPIVSNNPEKPLSFVAWSRVAGDETKRPVIYPIRSTEGMRIGDGMGYVRVVGLEFVGGGIAAVGSARDLTVIDTVVRDLPGTGFTVQGLDGKRVGGKNLFFRCRVENNRNPSAHVQGGFVSAADDVSFIECAFINVGNRDTFCQGLYLVHDALGKRYVRRSVFSDIGFAGVQVRGALYAEIVNCLFENTGNGFGIGHPMAEPANVWVTGVFDGNAIVNPKSPAWGIPIQRCNGVKISNNFVAVPAPLAIFIQPGQPTGTYELENNKIRPNYVITPEVRAFIKRHSERKRGEWGQEFDTRPVIFDMNARN